MGEDVLEGLRDARPSDLPEQLVRRAEELTGSPAALYVVDIEGKALLRGVGPESFPACLEIAGGIGPELGEQAVIEATDVVATALPGTFVAPLWMRCRATALLVARKGQDERLEELARAVAPIFEVASGYTDVADRVRRTRRTSPAAEMQQDLLAPRIARIDGAEIAGSMLPAYDVGGDWFDHAENPEGAWLSVADAMGKGSRAAATSGLALAALRAARRAGDSLEDCCRVMDGAIEEMAGESVTFLTTVIGTWHAPSRTFAWVRCGHPPPLLIGADGQVTELTGESNHPLGLHEFRDGAPRRNERVLDPGDRLVIYSDGISERRTDSGRLGVEGLVAAVASAPVTSAVATVVAVERAVLAASVSPIADDATQLVLAVNG